MNIPIDWLLEGEPWIVYRTRLDLLDQPKDDPQVVAARQAMLANPQVQALVSGLSDWPGEVIASHKSAGQPFHRLTFWRIWASGRAIPASTPSSSASCSTSLPRNPSSSPRTSPRTTAAAGRNCGRGRCAMCR